MKMPFVKTRRHLEVQKKLDEARAKILAQKEKISACQAELKLARQELKVLSGKSPATASVAPLMEKMPARQILSYRFLRGDGLEIGALHYPTSTAPGTHTKYYDYLSAEDNLKRLKGWEHVEKNKLVQVDYIGDGEKLELIEDGALDYLIANHMLEHCQNVIATLRVFWSKLKPGGHLFLAIPDKRYTFDYLRELTPFEHLVDDYRNGPQNSLYEHYVDFRRNSSVARDLKDFSEEELLKQPHVDIHFHVWTQVEIIEMFLRLKREHGFDWEIKGIMSEGNEVVVVLAKQVVEAWDHGDPATKPRSAAD